MSKIEQRDQQFLDLLQNYRRLDIKEVADWLSISEATARRMCSKLEKQNKVVRVLGGVQLPNISPNNYSFQNRASKFLLEKIAIGQYCASIIESGERIFCDSGTTVHQFVLSLSSRIQKGELQDIVLLTNSISNFNPIAENCKVILLGGEVRLSRMDMCGSISESTLSKFHITKAFLGADAINIEKGFMTTDERTAKMNEIVITDVEKAYVLVDSKKFNKKSFVSFAKQSDSIEIVTDWNMKEDIRKTYQDAGFKVRVLDRPKAEDAGQTRI